MFIVCKSMEIDAAHYLPRDTGKCGRMHGHRWKVEICVKAEDVDKITGMVVDFRALKQELEATVGLLDHFVLNEILENPTAENLAKYVYCELYPIRDIYRIRVWETPNSCVSFYPDRKEMKGV